jgi:hypothetical protein
MPRSDNFYFDPLVFYEPDSLKARLDVYMEIPAEKVLFKKNNGTGKYESSFSISVVIANSLSDNLINETYTKSPSFTEEEMKTVSKQSQYFLYNYYLKPGTYKIDIKLKDNHTNSEYSKSGNFIVKDLHASVITFSDLMLLSKFIISENGTKEITPLISKNIFGLKEFYVFFEIYSTGKEDVSKDYVYKIIDEKDYVLKEGQFSYLVNPGINQKTERISVLNELKRYLPGQKDFEFFPVENKPEENFKIEIFDKSGSDTLAVKNIYFRTGRPNREMYDRPHMH